MAALSAYETRATQLTLRSVSAGEVVTSRPEELVGRRVQAGDSLLQVARLDSVEVRITLTGGGATRVRAGQRVHLFSPADPETPIVGRVADVSVGGGVAGPSEGTVEARVRLSGAAGWRPGVRGEAKVDLQRSIVLGALVWKARQLVRGDLWL